MANHTIKYGDTLWAISRNSTGKGINYKLIAELNGLEDPNNVPIGTELYVPDKNTEKVSTKDLEEGNGFIEMDEYSPDYDYAVKGDSVYYRQKGDDTWSNISDAPGIRERFRDYITEEVEQAEPDALDSPVDPRATTLGNAANYAPVNPGEESPAQNEEEPSLFDQIMYYGNLVANGLKRAYLKQFGDNDRQSVLNVPDGTESGEIDPLSMSFTGDTVRVDNRRYFLPESLNIENARFGYRNRGDFAEREGIGAITAFNPFKPKSEINSKSGFYIGVDNDGRFKYGDISKFDNNDMVSRVYVNRVKSFDTNKDGSLKFKEAGKGNQGRYVPIINVVEGGRERKGSLNFLTGKDYRTDTYGDITGGRVLLITDDGRVRLVSGSIDDVRKEFERVKKLSGQDSLNVVVLDNGTYSRGLRTYDSRMTSDDLKSYDAQNTSGGNFLFIQDLMETNNIAKRRDGGGVSPLVYKTFNPEAFQQEVMNMEREGSGKGRKVDTKNMERIYYGLISRGVNGNQLKALMATITEESGGDPFAESSGKNYRGLSQWSKDRLTDDEFKSIKKMSVNDAIDYELDKLVDGLNMTTGSDSFTHGGTGSGYDSGQAAMDAFWNPNGTIESVVHALNNGYIRPGDREGTTENRIRTAKLFDKEGVLTDSNAPEEFDPIIKDPFFGYYKADGGPTKEEFNEMFRDLYQQDIERIRNGERAVFFGHLNDEPLINVYPEFDLIKNPFKVVSPKGNYGNVVGLSSEDAWKSLEKATDIQELILRVPYNLGRMLNEFVSDVSTKGAKKIIDMAPEKYRDTLTKIGRYVKRRPRLTMNFLSSFFYDDITGRNKEEGEVKEAPEGESFNDAFRRAKEAGESRFTWNGKEYTTETRPDGGPVLQRDAIQPPANPTMDFMNSIGEENPYYAGELPGVVITLKMDPDKYRSAMYKAAARRGREYVYKGQGEAKLIMQGLAGAAGAASLAGAGILGRVLNTGSDAVDILLNPYDPTSYLSGFDYIKDATAKANNLTRIKSTGKKVDEIVDAEEKGENMIKGDFGPNYHVVQTIKGDDEISKEVRKRFLEEVIPAYKNMTKQDMHIMTSLEKQAYKYIDENPKIPKNVNLISNLTGISPYAVDKAIRVRIGENITKLAEDYMKKPGTFEFNVSDNMGDGVGGAYKWSDDKVYISKDVFDGDRENLINSLIHEFRHKFDLTDLSDEAIAKKNSLDRIDADDFTEMIDMAYQPTYKSGAYGQGSVREKIATNAQLRNKIYSRYFYQLGINPKEGDFANTVDNMSDEDLMDLLEETSAYGKDYARSARDNFDVETRASSIRYLLKNLPSSIPFGVNVDLTTKEDSGNKQMKSGGEIKEDNLSPNEAILRRLASDPSTRKYFTENATYYSGREDMTPNELMEYVGKMKPSRIALSLESDDDELQNFSMDLTSRFNRGDESAGDDIELFRKMLIETPFNNSEVVSMKNGGSTLPGNDLLYEPKSLIKYEKGGEAVKDRQVYLYNRLKNEAHMSDYQALAVIGNLMAESGLNPDLWGDQHTAYGIQQWRGDRRNRLNKLAKEKGESEPSFETQVDYLINEYLAAPGKNGFLYEDEGKMGSGYYNYSRKDFRNASTLRDATVAWNLGSGRPHKDYMRNNERYNFARQAAKNIGVDLEDVDKNYYSDNGVVENGFGALTGNMAENTGKDESSTVKIEEGNIPSRDGSEGSKEMTDFQRSVINELLVQRGLIMGEQAKQQEEAEAKRKAEERQAMISEEARRNEIIQSVLKNAKLNIPGMASGS